MEKLIKFEKEAKLEILDLFDKAIDEENCIIEKETGKRILDVNGESIDIEYFAGIRKGSLIFVKSDINSLVELYDSLK